MMKNAKYLTLDDPEDTPLTTAPSGSKSCLFFRFDLFTLYFDLPFDFTRRLVLFN